jgi:nuclear pore complex protein Nup107
MDPSASRDTKLDALHRARQHNLDVAVIAKETVRMILEAAFAVSSSVRNAVMRLTRKNIPALSGDQPDVTSFASGVTESDVALIRSIEWLTLVPETAHEALVQSNAVARYFLGEFCRSPRCPAHTQP